VYLKVYEANLNSISPSSNHLLYSLFFANVVIEARPTCLFWTSRSIIFLPVARPGRWLSLPGCWNFPPLPSYTIGWNHSPVFFQIAYQVFNFFSIPDIFTFYRVEIFDSPSTRPARVEAELIKNLIPNFAASRHT
jgi:hypothetical protein